MMKLSTLGYFIFCILIGYEMAPTIPNVILTVVCLFTFMRYKLRADEEGK